MEVRLSIPIAFDAAASTALASWAAAGADINPTSARAPMQFLIIKSSVTWPVV
jgi:hypothetical protein